MQAKFVLCFLPLMVMANVTSASSCFDMKSKFIMRAETKIFDTCRELSGKNIHPAKRKVVQQVVREGWDSKATVECAASCGDSSSCVDNYTENLIGAALNEIIPRMTAEWCLSKP